MLFPTLSRHRLLRFAHLTSADLSALRHRARGGGRVRSRPRPTTSEPITIAVPHYQSLNPGDPRGSTGEEPTSVPLISTAAVNGQRSSDVRREPRITLPAVHKLSAIAADSPATSAAAPAHRRSPRPGRCAPSRRRTGTFSANPGHTSSLTSAFALVASVCRGRECSRHCRRRCARSRFQALVNTGSLLQPEAVARPDSVLTGRRSNASIDSGVAGRAARSGGWISDPSEHLVFRAVFPAGLDVRSPGRSDAAIR